MPRDAITLAGMRALRNALPSLDPVLFEASSTFLTEQVIYNDGLYRAELAKRGYTHVRFSNIYYTMNFFRVADGVAILPTALSIYVHRPSTADPTANRAAIAKALDSFMATEVTVLTRDVAAT
ncbi:hypothetical protein PYCCODRAFT_1437225 [Trametes coccinea BRFM310]|uniref:Uncharacterized protein n=1 Tax=Trametes coccinea (strain BRFM310) TaxID=1353009 RepID=A0A1Y2IJ20_TRAC3|nr:hypothetical protein PYCCODRAFT_1437225 [Trametes coccinea BRFM310]